MHYTVKHFWSNNINVIPSWGLTSKYHKREIYLTAPQGVQYRHENSRKCMKWCAEGAQEGRLLQNIWPIS